MAQMNDSLPSCAQALPQHIPKTGQPEGNGPICALMRPVPRPFPGRAPKSAILGWGTDQGVPTSHNSVVTYVSDLPKSQRLPAWSGELASGPT